MEVVMRVGSLFAGIGGFDLGLERAGMEIRWQVENNLWCQRVLAKHWPNVTRYGDIKQVDWHTIEPVDLVCGGFPCQPFSLAGKRKGFDDDRYLWPEVVRCLDAVRPTWFLGENVPGIVNVALDQVCADLEALGYAVQPICVPACAVDAPHQRQRVWILAHAGCAGLPRGGLRSGEAQTREIRDCGAADSREVVAHAQREGSQGLRAECGLGESRQKVEIGGGGDDVADSSIEQWDRWRDWTCGWEREPQEALRDARERGRQEAWMSVPESLLGRVAHGIPHRVDRLRGLGNAVVPQVVEVLGRMMIEVKHASLV